MDWMDWVLDSTCSKSFDHSIDSIDLVDSMKSMVLGLSCRILHPLRMR